MDEVNIDVWLCEDRFFVLAAVIVAFRNGTKRKLERLQHP